MKKALLLSVSAEIIETILAHLPEGVLCTAQRPAFEFNGFDVRLEGEGLPDWCKVHEGQNYMRGHAVLGEDKILRFYP